MAAIALPPATPAAPAARAVDLPAGGDRWWGKSLSANPKSSKSALRSLRWLLLLVHPPRRFNQAKNPPIRANPTIFIKVSEKKLKWKREKKR